MKAYLGDSVYCDFDGYNIILVTDNGFGPSNTIILGPEVMSALIKYSTKIKAQAENEIENEGYT